MKILYKLPSNSKDRIGFTSYAHEQSCLLMTALLLFLEPGGGPDSDIAVVTNVAMCNKRAIHLQPTLDRVAPHSGGVWNTASHDHEFAVITKPDLFFHQQTTEHREVRSDQYGVIRSRESFHQSRPDIRTRYIRT